MEEYHSLFPLSAASGISNSKGPLGDFYRRIRSFAGAPKALVAVARKPAVIYYRMMTTKQAFHPEALVQSQKKYKQHKIKQQERKLKKLKSSA
ncbi:MAG: hypothetical protein LBB90_09855 [Tannerella sp.]|nr:hypothetical protein [Tannerella sp.]